MAERKFSRNFKKKGPNLTTEQKAEQFVIRNSKNGYFTKVSTLSYKFGISEESAWNVVGELLSSGLFESVHDEYTGEMKLCENGKTYSILDLERKRKKDKYKNNKKQFRKKSKSNTNS